MVENSEKYIDSLAQSVKFVLNAKRGKFYPNKNFGSLIYEIAKESSTQYALDYARQAVEGINGVYVKAATKTDNGYSFKLSINGFERMVEIKNDNILQ